MINFTSSKEELDIIGYIASRYIQEVVNVGIKPRTKVDIMMDVEATHCNGNPLKLKELLEADIFNFMHDISGIQNNLNRKTGKLDNCFSPRYSA